MKKILSLLLALTISLLFAFSMVSCSNEEDTDKDDDEDNEESATITDYKVYTDNDISFEYPKDWKVREGSIVCIIAQDDTGNNINIVFNTKTDVYDDITLEDFNKHIKPTYEFMGASISNSSVEHLENENNVKITKFAFTIVLKDITVLQTQYCFNTETKTYVITISEHTAAPELPQNIFNTIKIL